MQRTSIISGIPFVAFVGFAACKDEGPGGLTKVDPVVTILETKLSAASMLAGESADVECLATYDDGSMKTLLPPDVTVSVEPAAEGTQIVDARITIQRSGVYDVACKSPTASQVISAALEVRAAVPVKAIATLDRATIASAEVATGSCRLEDEVGNVVEDLQARFEATPADGVTINGAAVTGMLAGAYAITCAVDGFDVEKVPAPLTVTAGSPYSVRVFLADNTVFAGDRVDVVCLVADAAGNEVMVETDYTVAPAVSMTDAAGFTPTTAGAYEVVCTIPASGLSSTPEPLSVAPGLPARIAILEVVPQKAVYSLSEVVELRARVTDAWDNEPATASWEATSNPPTATRFAGLHFVELAVEGPIEVVARVTTPTAGGSEVSASTILITDGTPPVITISFPERAEIVAGPSGGSLQIIGQAVDATSRVTSVSIAGTPIPVDAAGNFQATITPAWGINLIEGTAADEAGNLRDFAQSFEYSAQYRQAGSNRIASGRIGDGLGIRLGQAVLDDNASDVDDLATIARLAVQNADIESLIPDPVTTYNSDCSVWPFTITGALRLHVDDVRFGTPLFDITAISGGVHLRVEIPNLVVDVHTSGDVCDIGVGVSGNATATRAIIEGDVLISRSGTNVVVSMPSASVTLQGFGIHINLPSVISWAVNGILNLFEGRIGDEVESALNDVIRSEVPAVVDDFLSSLSLETQLTLPAPVSLSLGIDSRLGMLAFNTGRGELGLDTTIYATGQISPEPMGGILQDARPWPAFSTTRAIGVGIAYDLINQALYSTWYGGGLELDLAQFIPGAIDNNGQPVNVQALASALLPPVLAPSSDPQYPVELQIGDLEVQLNLTGVPGFPAINATLYATVFAQANAAINAAGELELTMAPNPYVALDFTSSLPGVDFNALIANLEQTFAGFVPQLFNQVVGGIPIPSFDLSTMAGSFLPPGIVLGIGNATTAFHPAYLVLEGDLIDLP